MNSKVLVLIVALLILTGLFLASPRGRDFLEKSKLNDKVGTLGNFFKNLTGKVTSVKQDPSNKIQISMTGIDPKYLDGINFQMKNSRFDIDGTVSLGSIDSATVSFKTKSKVSSENSNGQISYKQSNFLISGKTSEIWVDNFGMNKTDMSFSFEFSPSEYEITNLENAYIDFKQISGGLSWVGLKVPAMLQNDRLEVFDFQGKIRQKNGLVYIEGYASHMKLNNIPIGSSK
ncbi:MAG: hypothetical protein N3D75_02290 [Candidatus Aenigmarchaeota archaeon]|nr:hypothetical protein [Candidatus Aenigmarchaeota archaeon]